MEREGQERRVKEERGMEGMERRKEGGHERQEDREGRRE